jgi:hypothetical protein
MKTATITMKAGHTLSEARCAEAFRDTTYGVASFKPAESSAGARDTGS